MLPKVQARRGIITGTVGYARHNWATLQHNCYIHYHYRHDIQPYDCKLQSVHQLSCLLTVVIVEIPVIRFSYAVSFSAQFFGSFNSQCPKIKSFTVTSSHLGEAFTLKMLPKVQARRGIITGTVGYARHNWATLQHNCYIHYHYRHDIQPYDCKLQSVHQLSCLLTVVIVEIPVIRFSYAVSFSAQFFGSFNSQCPKIKSFTVTSSHLGEVLTLKMLPKVQAKRGIITGTVGYARHNWATLQHNCYIHYHYRHDIQPYDCKLQSVHQLSCLLTVVIVEIPVIRFSYAVSFSAQFFGFFNS